jgi:hypothetical protein
MPATDIDKELAAAITAAKNKEHNFAIVAKGPNVVHLFVSKLPIKDTEVQKAKKAHSGNAVMRGKCQGQNGELVFRLAEDPSVQEKKLKEFITSATQLPVKPRFEVVAVDALEGERKEAEQPNANASNTPEAGENPSATAAAPPAPSGDPAAFNIRLKTLKPAMDAVRTAETSVTAELTALAAEMASQAGNQQFAEASEILKRIEGLLKTGLIELHAKRKAAEKAAAPQKKPDEAKKTEIAKKPPEPAKPAQPPEPAKPSQPKKPVQPNPAVAFAGRFKPLKAEIDKVLQNGTPLAATMKSLAAEMVGAAKANDFARAGQSLDEIERLLKAGEQPAGKEGPPPEDEAFPQAWAAGLARLEDALDEVADQLAEFGGALMESGEENLMWIAETGLSQLLTSLREAASAVDRATSKSAAKVVVKARPALAELKKRLQSPRVKACDENRLGVDVTIQETIGNAIRELETALAMVKS